MQFLQLVERFERQTLNNTYIVESQINHLQVRGIKKPIRIKIFQLVVIEMHVFQRRQKPKGFVIDFEQFGVVDFDGVQRIQRVEHSVTDRRYSAVGRFEVPQSGQTLKTSRCQSGQAAFVEFQVRQVVHITHGIPSQPRQVLIYNVDLQHGTVTEVIGLDAAEDRLTV